MTDIEMKIICKQLIDKYGEKQVVVAIEELSELQKELCKSLRGKTNKENIIEEMADVIIMINQMQMYFKISDEELHKEINYKLNRTKERLLTTEEPRDLEMEVYEEFCVGCSDEKLCHEECEHCVQFYERLEEKENGKED